MNDEQRAIEDAIKQKIVQIADAIGEDARDLGNDESIPGSGLVDSAGLLQLIGWYEEYCKLKLAPQEITIDNLGTISAMAAFALSRRPRA